MWFASAHLLRRSLLTNAGYLNKGGVVLLRYCGDTYGLFARLQ